MKRSKAKSRRVRSGKPTRSLQSTPLVEFKGTNRTTIGSTWSFGLISSDSTGTISYSNCGLSIANASTFSLIRQMYGEVRLLKATVIFSIVQPFNSFNTNDTMAVGTCMVANENNNVPPVTRGAVLALSRPALIPTTFSSGPLVYRVPVPRDLQFSSIDIDAPVVETPYAGSPGAVYMYATGLTPASDYFRVDVIATHEVRGRQYI